MKGVGGCDGNARMSQVQACETDDTRLLHLQALGMYCFTHTNVCLPNLSACPRTASQARRLLKLSPNPCTARHPTFNPKPYTVTCATARCLHRRLTVATLVEGRDEVVLVSVDPAANKLSMAQQLVLPGVRCVGMGRTRWQVRHETCTALASATSVTEPRHQPPSATFVTKLQTCKESF